MFIDLVRRNKVIYRTLMISCLLLAVSACASKSTSSAATVVNLGELVYSNQMAVSTLTVGMDRAQVVTHFGSIPARTRDGIVPNPFRSETFRGSETAQFEILYFITEMNRPFQPLRIAQATPLIFEDGELIGWGTDFLNQLKREYGVR